VFSSDWGTQVRSGNVFDAMKLRHLSILLTVVFRLMSIADGQCGTVPTAVRAQITTYLAQRIVPASIGPPNLSILSMTDVGDTCYKKILVQVTGTAAPLTFYLSPDLRFLVSTLYDLTKSPTQEAAEIAANVAHLLDQDQSPRLSGVKPVITLVEFGDLQCPYCRRFAEWYESLPGPLLDSTSLVFKHLPLPQHSWARTAADYAACANRQSTTAFWSLSNYLFAHQEDIGPASIKEQILAAVAQEPNVDTAQLVECVRNGTGATLVERDINVAKELEVTSTPTVFVHGRRIQTLHSRDDLVHVLARELQDSATSTVASGRK
jgi:protein-disulfide isomerase